MKGGSSVVKPTESRGFCKYIEMPVFYPEENTRMFK
jgi:hypothetical protein